MTGKRRATSPTSPKKTPAKKASATSTKAKQGSKGSKDLPKTWKTRLKKAAIWTAITGLVLTLLSVATFIYLYKTIDIPEANPEFLTETTFVYYDDGSTELGRFATQFRDSIPLTEMPDNLKDAVVAAEDRSFYSNSGIDPKGILRAAFSNASGGSTQGASTITQQYVKILYLTQERSYTRKIKEAILSLKVQREQSKEEVLGGYLNAIYFGRGAYGVEAAANVYFSGKKAADLTLRQSAVLATVLNDPNDLDPANGPEAKAALKDRYEYVLNSMAELGYITDEQAAKAKERLPKFPPQDAEDTYGGQKGHMLTLVKNQLLQTKKTDGDGSGEYFTEEEVNGGGLRITTTLTEKAMGAAEEGVKEAKPEGFGDRFLHIAVASVEPGTGALRGFYAGQDYLDSQLNWAVLGGQAGSTFKPFAVAAALKDGYSLRDTFDGNSPYLLPDGSDVENQGDSDYGSAVSLITATERSVNTAFIDLTVSMEDGPEKIVEMANAMGIPPAKAKKNGPGIPEESLGLEAITGVALGSQTVSPINMANGYATIANGGVKADPYVIERVVDANGEVLYEHRITDDRAIGADIAADVSYALQQVIEGYNGTGSVAEGLERPAAGKTGTATATNGDVSSAWFTGYTPQLSTAVMYVRGRGNEQLKDWLPSYFGGAYPAETWLAVMKLALEGEPIEEFPEPEYVDGDAPEDGHAPYIPPPKPTKKPTEEPTETEEPTATEEPTETEEPTTEPTEEPTESEPPCGLLGCPPSSEPTATEEPSDPPSSAAPAPRMSASQKTTPWWAMPALFGW